MDSYAGTMIGLFTIDYIIKQDFDNDSVLDENGDFVDPDEYYNNFVTFEDDSHSTDDYVNGFLKSITVVEETKDVFIEFDAYLVDFGDIMIMPLFKNCKAIGFSVDGKSDDEDHMTVGVLLDSPFEGYF